MKVCAQCGSDEISEQKGGDELITVCRYCHSVEGGYLMVDEQTWAISDNHSRGDAHAVGKTR